MRSKEPKYVQEYWQKYYKTHLEQLRRRHREYNKTRPSRKHRNYTELSRKYRKNHPDRAFAQMMVYNHKIPRLSYCQFGGCDSTKNLQRAHMDYSKPLEILTFCSRHHSLIDRVYRGVD